MIYDNLPLPFPWYDRKEKQVRFKAKGDFAVPHLIAPRDTVLPFQFRRRTTGQYPATWKVFDLQDNLITDLSGYIPNISAVTREGYDYFWYTPPPLPIGDPEDLELLPGCYYCFMGFPEEGLDMWSETFEVPMNSFASADRNHCDYLRLEWQQFGAGDVPPIYYPASIFKNVCYLDTRITASEPTIEEEVEADGNNVDIPVFQRAVIPYRISAFVSDYMKVALYVMQLHNNVFLTTQNGLESGEMKNISISSEVQDGGFTSTIDILFEQDIAVISKTCGPLLDRGDCPDMPTNEYLGLTVVSIGGTWKITATLPPYSYAANIFYIPDEGDPTPVKIAKVTRAQLAAGYITPHAGAAEIYIQVLTFSCILGNSNHIGV